ncbi:DUF6804 family protein [Amnibacterium endophyticum]|uniref:DUF6804 family protein n=1 Tax=Amnibacterium endophyticum TaxID=2109337 RepID=A0ABW4LKP8_9MICO
MNGNRAERRAAARAPQPSPQRYGSGKERRALAPAALGAVVLLSGLLLIGTGLYVVVLYVVSVLALITAVLVGQAGRWAWLPVPIVVAVLWNPVLPFAFSGQPFRIGHVVAAAALVLTGTFARYDTRRAGAA